MQCPCRMLSLICWLGLLAAVAFAKPNFTGEWKMNPAQSDFGSLPVPERMVRTIEHDEPSLKFKTTMSGPQGEVTTELAYTTDGKETTNTIRGSEVRGAARWEGDVLIIESKRSVQGMELTQTDRWTMAADARSMKVLTRLKTPQGEVEITITFDKQ